LYKTGQGFAQKTQIKIGEHPQAGDVIKERGTEKGGLESSALYEFTRSLKDVPSSGPFPYRFLLFFQF